MIPSRTAFMSRSSVPSSPAIEATEYCPICMAPHTKALKTPCGHEFCEECILRWLKMKNNNKNVCPVCKAVIFVLSSDDPDPIRRAVLSAVRSSGLTRVNNSEKEFETYGSDLYTISALQEGVTHAIGYLVNGGQSNPPGRVLIDISRLSADFVAMGNMVQEFARASGREYTTQEKAGWKLVLTHLWIVLKDWDGKRKGVLTFPNKLRCMVMERLRETYSDSDGIRPFFFEESRSADLDLMLNFLTTSCRIAYEAESRVPVSRTNQPRTRTRRCTVM